MKRLLFAAMMVTATTAFAAENDTLIIEKPQRVTIITSDSLQSIRVKGKEGDNHFDYQNTIESGCRFLHGSGNSRRYQYSRGTFMGNRLDDCRIQISPKGKDEALSFSRFWLGLA